MRGRLSFKHPPAPRRLFLLHLGPAITQGDGSVEYQAPFFAINRIDVEVTLANELKAVAMRRALDRALAIFCAGCALLSATVFVAIVVVILGRGLPAFDWTFVVGATGQRPS